MTYQFLPKFEDDNLTYSEKLILFKMVTILMSIIFEMDTKFGMTKDELIKDVENNNLQKYDKVDIVHALKVSHQLMGVISDESNYNPELPKNFIKDGVNIYKSYYIHILEDKYKLDYDLTKWYKNYLTKKLDSAVLVEDYELADEINTKILQIA